MSTTTVRTGHWVDTAYNSVTGSRVTLSSSSAAILIAFVALFDGLVGNIFWSLLSLLIHRHRAKENKPRDGLYHQLQALLRNSNEPLGFTQDAFMSGWGWRGKARRPMSRALLLVTLAISSSLLFSAAGVLSSQIASTGTVLLTGDNCGSFYLPNYIVSSEEYAIVSQVTSQYASWLRESIEYARSCYHNVLQNQSSPEYSSGASCDLYVTPILNWTTTIGNPCPFADPTICSVPESDIIKLDTGYLDSSRDLGINLPDSRVLFRRVETCSPITFAGFSNNSFTKTDMPGNLKNISIYSYGHNLDQPGYLNSNISIDWLVSNNVTFIYPESSYLSSDLPYSLIAVSSMSQPNVSYRPFVPDPRITKDEKFPVSLFFLANRAFYTAGPVEDPWFKATQYSGPVISTKTPYYYNANPGSVLACVEQAQVCNPNGTKPICNDLTSSWAELIDPDPFAGLRMTPTQQQIAFNIMAMIQSSTFYYIAYAMGQDSLSATNQIVAPTKPSSPTLPSDQWQIEVLNWMSIANANLQRLNLAQITGPTNTALLKYWLLNTSKQAAAIYGSAATDIANAICAAQKVKSTAYQSFSVLGLAINFAVGGSLLLAGLSLKYIVPRVQRRRLKSHPLRRSNYHRYQTWVMDGTLQLQRIAYENLGLGDWEGEETVPFTKEGQFFLRPVLVSQEGGGSVITAPESTCGDVASGGYLDAKRSSIVDVVSSPSSPSSPGDTDISPAEEEEEEETPTRPSTPPPPNRPNHIDTPLEQPNHTTATPPHCISTLQQSGTGA